MNLNIFVHDFYYEIGHAKAMIEVINNLKPDKITKVRIVSYTCGDLERIFKEQGLECEHDKVPFAGLKPFILKAIFFQFYTWLFQRKWTSKDSLNVGIGVCSFVPTVINIQFAHFLWENLYFKTIPTKGVKYLYKKLLLRYLTLCEDYFYKKRNLKFVVLSQFMADALKDRYQLAPSQLTVAYSSASATRFKNISQSREENLDYIKKRYPELKDLDTTKPCHLFVGAWERKGLPLFINEVPSDQNLIIIGKGETGGFELPSKENLFHINYTKEVEVFYQACDTFVFPTLYEPFGLVLIEAALCGMHIITSLHQVGASEILKNCPGITFLNPYKISQQHFTPPFILRNTLRQKWSEERFEHLKDYTWQKCAKKWESVIYKV